MHRTRVSRATAGDHAGWSRRTRTHPRILAALAAGDISRSYARTICGWTGRLPEDCRGNADGILVSAARMGMGLADPAALAAEIAARARPDAPDEDGPRFEDRAVKLESTFGGAGVMTGDLTPECAAVVTAVLDALSAPRGADPTAPPPRGTATGPRYCAATARPPTPSNPPAPSGGAGQLA